ncbi:3'-5' exonuclease [Rivibacter subsaxonicus]|uniref:DNA polymerase-3 subunit epsilon n=1 Tax=Rivibacter subsaxonicus TaxID=457575 RepID=A0A4Q7VVS8_9BURK|nr:3'-5' exonuclease [Rivibacter subsaxonicus]RZU00605.1 DNA polymerase-3 subunit epsilon [Rivibacter subsaxonicus]
MSLWRQAIRHLGGQASRTATRWAVVDVEASGLDARRDRLLAIAAIAIDAEAAAPRIVLGDSFEVVLRQDEVVADKPNILLHGIGVGAQRGGVPAAQALQDFERWRAGAPLLAFHAAFDQTLIARAFASRLRRRLDAEWVDLEHVAEVVQPAVAARTLDEWMAHFGIRCAQRHQAAADALATAELLLKLWPAIRRQAPRPDFGALQQMAGQRRWLP